MRVREFRAGDAPLLLDLFRDTVRRVNCADYGPEQIRAWASDEIDPAQWAARFQGRYCVVAELDGEVVAFTDLTTEGHIDRFFVSADHQRQGVGRALIGKIFDEAQRLDLAELTVDASLTAREFFESFRFVVQQKQEVISRGVTFANYRMHRVLR